MKCKFCGFDSEEDSLYAEGAPCGYHGCLTFTCCQEAWMEHMRGAHPESIVDGKVVPSDEDATVPLS